VKIRLNGFARMSVMSFVLAGVFAQGAPEHGPAWLNDHGTQTIKWLKERNSQTLTELRADPRFATFESEAAGILTDPGRLTPVTFTGDHVYQYWQTRDSPFGVWRRTRRVDYLAGAPNWETVIDIQALGAAEHARFIFAGADCLESRCLISLSRNGKDAVEQREFDLDSKQFVRNGFHIPESKTQTWWYDANTLLVAPAFVHSEMTEGLTARTIRVWARGTPLKSSRTLFEGRDSDAGVSVELVKAAASGNFVAARDKDFERREYRLVLLDGSSRPLALPETAAVVGVHAGKLLIRPNRDWTLESGVVVPNGTLAAIDLDTLMREGKISSVEVIYAPTGDDAIRSIRSSDGRLFVELLHDYASRLVELTPRKGGAWEARTIPLPGGLYVQIMDFAPL
jgi:prolyl oligopeptidase